VVKRVVVFRYVPAEGLGIIADCLDAAGLSWAYVDLPGGTPAPPLDSASALIFMGGPMSANDGLPYIRREIQLIETGIVQDKPVLGICLGAQLIAKALGAKVYRNPVKEIGWYPVSWTDEAGRDLLFSGLTQAETVFHWHGETFDLPPGSVWLAESQACRNQAFRFGTNVHGLQFHLEVTPEMITEWCATDSSGELPPIDPVYNAVRLKELGSLVFGRWIRAVLEPAP
jgi:GMP synthase (glutamine-hydrolysing)